MSDEPVKALSIKEALDFYENGKNRRYSLLFAVNGAVFGLATLAGKEKGAEAMKILAVAMVIFTAATVVDIWKFGMRSRKNAYFAGPETTPAGPDLNLFAGWGRFLLLLIGTLIAAGWLLAGFGIHIVAIVPVVAALVWFGFNRE